MFKKFLIVTLILAGSLTLVLTAGANPGYAASRHKTPTPTATPRPTTTPIATIAATTTPNPTATPLPTAAPGAGQLYWGAWISDDHLTAPYDYVSETQPGILGAFETRAGKKVSIIHFGQAWKDSTGTFNSFSVVTNRTGNNPVSGSFDKIRAHGAIPLLDWGSWQSGAPNPQSNFSLATILTGVYDTYLTQWAHDAAAWGHPFFLRFDWEANGDWFPWGTKGGYNGNTAAQYVAVWRHVHDIFVAQGATNVTWVWSLNTDYTGATPIASLYPGATYVDWSAVDCYNWSVDKNDVWLSFTEVCQPTYNILNTVAPGKPIMVTEMGTSKDRPASDTDPQHTKPNWIYSALTTELPVTFPNVRALVWFNWDARSATLDWPIEGNSYSLAAGAPIDQASIDAFNSGVTNSRYVSNVFGSLSTTPIMPLQ